MLRGGRAAERSHERALGAVRASRRRRGPEAAPIRLLPTLWFLGYMVTGTRLGGLFTGLAGREPGEPSGQHHGQPPGQDAERLILVQQAVGVKHLAPRSAGAQGGEAVLAHRAQGEHEVVLLDRRVGVLEVEAGADLALGLIDRIAEFLAGQSSRETHPTVANHRS